MSLLTGAVRARIALITALSLVLSQNAGLVLAQAPAAKPAATAKPAAAPAAKPAATSNPQTPVDGGWPRSYTTNSGAALVIYQPQVATWDKQTLMTAYAAASYTPAGAAKPALGTFQLEADTEVSVAERLVSFSKYRINEANFPSLPKEQLRSVVAEVTNAVPPNERVIGLDRVLAAVDKSQIIPKKRRGREGRSAADLLQRQAGHHGQHRRRSDLEPHQGQRSQVRRQHELGSVPARAQQDLLPAQQRLLAEGIGREGAVGGGRHSCPRASRSSPPTTTGRTSRRTSPGRRASRRRCM